MKNLHAMFVPDSLASNYYHKYLEPYAASLKDCFRRLYARFKCSERRDRLVREWNSHDMAHYSWKTDATPPLALADLC